MHHKYSWTYGRFFLYPRLSLKLTDIWATSIIIQLTQYNYLHEEKKNYVLEILVYLHQLFKEFTSTVKQLFIQSDEFYLGLWGSGKEKYFRFVQKE